MPAAICHHRKPEIIFSLFLLLAVSPPSQTMVAILKVMNSSILSCYNACSMNATCVLHKACLLHAFFPHDWGWCWMQTPWQGDWQCVCKFLHRSLETLALNDSVSVHMTRWSPVSRPGKASDKKNKNTLTSARACMKQHITFPAFAHWRKSMKLYKMIPPTVCNLSFLLCNLWFTLPCLSEWTETWLCFHLNLICWPFCKLQWKRSSAYAACNIISLTQAMTWCIN